MRYSIAFLILSSIVSSGCLKDCDQQTKPISTSTEQGINTVQREWMYHNVNRESTIYQLWGTAESDMWASDIQGLLYRFDGRSWVVVQNPAHDRITGFWGMAENDFWMLASSQIFHWDGNLWTKRLDYLQTFPQGFYALWGSSPSAIWAVGGGLQPDVLENGKPYTLPSPLLARYDGHEWSGDRSSIRDIYVDIWGSSSTDVWVVGLAGSITHYDGKSWSLSDGQWKGRQFTSIWGSSANDIYAVGGKEDKSGFILHYDGTSWKQLSIALPRPINKIHGTSKSDVWAIPSAEEILHFDGEAWERFPTTPKHVTFYTVCALSKRDAWFGGSHGILTHMTVRE